MMGKVRINMTSGDDSTPISNAFIDEYLEEANDAQIKVYLYLLRMMEAGRSTSVSDLADKFNHTEKDVLRALHYWEKLGLLGLEYDNAGRLNGIHIEDVASKQDTSPHVPLPARKEVPAPAPAMEPAGSASVSSPCTGRILRMPGVKAREASTEPLLFIAEQYFGRPLNPNEMSTILYIRDDLGFSEDLVDYLMQYCAERGACDFRYLEKVAVSWSEKGISTVDEARNETLRHDRDVYDILRSLGIETNPTDKELSYVAKWRTEYGFSTEVIKEACDRAVLSTVKGRIPYCDGILRKWKKSGVKSLEDIKKLDEEHSLSIRAQNASPSKRDARGTGPDTANRFNLFEQSGYDFEELERKIVEN